MSKLSPELEDIRGRYDLVAADFWELPQRKGTWIIKHSAIEKVIIKAHIAFDHPQIIEADTKQGIAALAVRGFVQNDPTRTAWATGEAAPGNNKNQYPWAMAEKRAKDRVVLKLTGIEAYSEDEADDFKQNTRQSPTDASEAFAPPVEDSTAKLVFPVLQNDLRACATRVQLDGSWSRWQPQIAGWSLSMTSNADDVYDGMVSYLNELDGDGRKASRDVIEAELRAAVSMEDLNGKRNKFREGFMKLGKDDQLYLSKVGKEIEAVIAKMGGKMPAFDTLTPEQEHAAKIAATP